MDALAASEIIDRLSLQPHPEGGWYRQTWEHEAGDQRSAGTAIYYLLEAGQCSHWHHVDATEIWHYYSGSPLVLSLADGDAGPARELVLGPSLEKGETPQIIVPRGHWQSAVSTGAWTLVGCTVSPGFQFEGFTLAPEGFDIPREPSDG